MVSLAAPSYTSPCSYRPPPPSDFCYITDNTYQREQVVHMEEVILKKLSYELTVPTAKTFLRRLLQVWKEGR